MSTRASVKADADDDKAVALTPGKKKGGKSRYAKEELREQEGAPGKFCF